MINLDFIDLKTLLVILHLLGVALGAGGAYTSDFIFMSSLKDKIFENAEIRILKLCSAVVWIGVIVLIISGTGLFFLDPVKYLHSTKFLSKVVIVGIIVANGAYFYYAHMKHIIDVAEKNIATSGSFRYYSVALYLSGAVSVVSWTTALVLGTLKSLPFSIPEILSAYGAMVALGMMGALIARYNDLRAK